MEPSTVDPLSFASLVSNRSAIDLLIIFTLQTFVLNISAIHLKIIIYHSLKQQTTR